jgi:gliding motility-associated lipoprotein GldH
LLKVFEMKKTALIFIGICLLLSSCDRAKIYEKYQDNDRITWNRFDVKTFQVDIKDISASYDFYIAIRHIDAFPLDYITVRFVIYTPSGETRTLEQKIRLKDENGNWLGDGMGDLWDITHLARKGLQFTQAGTCTVEISSTMSQADLPGIMQVGLIVKRS